MPTCKVLVTVLNYRGAAVLMPCLESLALQLLPGDALLVVDHGNETALMQKVREVFPQFEILTPPANGGFAQGMNRGLRKGLEQGFDAVWIVNNDAIAESGALAQLRRAAEERAALFSPVIVNPQGAIWFAGGGIDWIRMRTYHSTGVAKCEKPFQTQFLTGCALFIPTSIIKQVGLFDERYFLYYEDAEYSERVKKAGGELLVVPQARVVHSEESQKNPEKIYWLVRSGVIFFFTQAKGWKKGVIAGVFLLRRIKNWLECMWKPSPVAESVKRAYTDALKSLHV